MMGNTSVDDLDILHFGTFEIAQARKYPIVILGLFFYMITVAFNLTLLLLIIKDKTLHRPMYFILLNQQLNDLLGSGAMIPKVLFDILTNTDIVQYHLCVVQGFLLHIYGGGTLLILSALAIDRYIAICNPLRYNSIMSLSTVVATCFIIWGLDFVIIFSIFIMQVKLPRCQNSLRYVFCDNQSLVRLSCADKTVINIYSLFTYVFIQSLNIGLQLVSYIKIICVCLQSNKSETWSKAVHTCLAQILVALIFQLLSLVNIISNQQQYLSDSMQSVIGMLICIIPPFLNPIIYGLKLNEIRAALKRMCVNLFKHH